MEIEGHIRFYDEARGVPDKETDSVLKSESGWAVNIDDTHAVKSFLFHNWISLLILHMGQQSSNCNNFSYS